MKSLTLNYREYRLIGLEDGGLIDTTVCLEDILLNDSNSNEYEYIYSLQDEAEKILKLDVGETLFVGINRDVPQYKGVILRLS